MGLETFCFRGWSHGFGSHHIKWQHLWFVGLLWLSLQLILALVILLVLRLNQEG